MVFLVPGASRTTGRDRIGGGVRSICSIYEETVLLAEEFAFAPVLCTLPRESIFDRHTRFPSEIDVFRFDQLPEHFRELRSVLIHVPEYAAAAFAGLLTPGQRRWLSAVPDVQINVMNQNITLLPDSRALAGLRAITPRVTMTTAHERYCTGLLRDRYAMPVHHLSVRVGPEQYRRVPYAEKEDLAVFSPDDAAKNDQVAGLLATRCPRIRIQVIKGLSYMEYRHLVERAKWMFTFGEGLDFYFVESVFSGGIAAAVANDDFFTNELNMARTVYPSFESLLERLPGDIEELDDPQAYASAQAATWRLLSVQYSTAKFADNLRRFYEEDYTFPLEREPGRRPARPTDAVSSSA